jgi:hypothetical protein
MSLSLTCICPGDDKISASICFADGSGAMHDFWPNNPLKAMSLFTPQVDIENTNPNQELQF